MLPCGQLGIDAVEALKKSNRELMKTLMEIAYPDFPNPFDERYDLELLLDGASEAAEEKERIKALLAGYRETHGR